LQWKNKRKHAAGDILFIKAVIVRSVRNAGVVITVIKTKETYRINFRQPGKARLEQDGIPQTCVDKELNSIICP
jgi:hypothetical protein